MVGRKPTSAAVGRSDFAALLADVKGRIQAAQTRAMLAVNGELVRLYWDIGRIIVDRQLREGWGAAVIPRLALKLKNELPDLKGFSERNIDRMIAFCRGYPIPSDFSPPAVAKSAQSEKVPRPVAKRSSTVDRRSGADRRRRRGSTRATHRARGWRREIESGAGNALWHPREW